MNKRGPLDLFTYQGANLKLFCNFIDDHLWEKAEHLPSLENLHKLRLLVFAGCRVWDHAGLLEDQVHDVVDVEEEARDVAALHVLEDGVHDVQVFELAVGRLDKREMRQWFVG